MQKVAMFLNIKLRADDDCQNILPHTISTTQQTDECMPTLEFSYAYLVDEFEFSPEDTIPTDQGGFSAPVS